MNPDSTLGMYPEPSKYLATVTIQLVTYAHDEHDARYTVERILDGIGAHYNPDNGIEIDPTE